MPPAVTTRRLDYPVAMQIINQYSFAIFGVAGLLVVALLVALTGRGRGRLAVVALAAAALAGGWLIVRPTATPAADIAQVRGQIGRGVPVLLELQSPY